MIVAHLFDLAVYDLHYFRADRLDFRPFGSGPRKVRLRDPPTAVARAHPQPAVCIRKVIKVLNGVWKGRHRVFVFLRSKRENNPAPGSGYAMNSRR
jgi:hypothetical protein